MSSRPAFLAGIICLAGCAPGPGTGPALGIDFVCDTGWCTSWNPLALGSEVELRLAPTTEHDPDLLGTDLVSAAPDLLEVLDYQAAEREASALIVARRSGVTAVEVIDADGYPIDEQLLEVRAPDSLSIVGTSSNIFEIDWVAGLGRHFRVETGSTLVFDVTPYQGDEPLLGRLAIAVEVDESAVPPEQWLEPIDPATLADGRFSVRVTAGSHDLTISAPGTGASERVRVTGQ